MKWDAARSVPGLAAATDDLRHFLVDLSRLKSGPRRAIEKALERGGSTPDQQIRLLKPVGSDAKLILTAGREALSRFNDRRPEKMIVGFSKFATAFADPGSIIRLPRDGARFDADVALCAVIGRRAERVTTARDALRCVAGFTLMIDVTDREVFEEEGRTNNSLFAKNRPGLSPLGPSIWGAEEAGINPSAEISLKLNGTIRQCFLVGDLAHGISDAVRAWSRTILDAGDAVALGAAIARPGPANIVESPIAIAAGDTLEAVCAPLDVLAAQVALEGDG